MAAASRLAAEDWVALETIMEEKIVREIIPVLRARHRIPAQQSHPLSLGFRPFPGIRFHDVTIVFNAPAVGLE